MAKKAKNPVRTARRMLQLIEVLEEGGEARVSELADELGVSKSTVHNHLSTLQEHEYVVQEGDFYRVGLRFLELGETARSNSELYRFGRTEADKLANDIGELVNLVTEENGYAVYLYRKRGTNDVNFSTKVGQRLPIHSTAVGKAILAYLPEPRVQQIIDEHGLPRATANTITDYENLKEELETVRNQKIAFDNEESDEGIQCVATPVLSINKRPLGALSISAPTTRLTDSEFKEESMKALKEAANIIEINLRV